MHVESAALYGEKLTYSISFLEVVQALGIAAMVAIGFMLGIWLFAMLPTRALMHEQLESPDAVGSGSEEPTAAAST
jgi:hypothetical protein